MPPIPARAGGSSGSGPQTRDFFLNDPLGSLGVVLSEDGSLVREVVHRPFGAIHQEASAAGPGDYDLYAGHRRENDTGLHYMQARWCNPETGTFLSIDPVIADSADPQALNAQSYARNNPLRFIDSTGLNPETVGQGMVTDAADRAQIALGLTRARSQVDPTRNLPVGTVLKRKPRRPRSLRERPKVRQEKGILTLFETSEDVVKGFERKRGGALDSRGEISDAAAFAISEAPWVRHDQVEGTFYQKLSDRFGGVPVFVSTPRDGTVVLFEGRSEPVRVNLVQGKVVVVQVGEPPRQRPPAQTKKIEIEGIGPPEPPTDGSGVHGPSQNHLCLWYSC